MENKSIGAVGFVKALRANVADMYADRVTFEEFNARQGATWDAIKGRGPRVENRVLAILRVRS